MSEYLLKIFRNCIPRMSKSAAKFGQTLQQNLQSMVLKPPPSGGLTVSHHEKYLRRLAPDSLHPGTPRNRRVFVCGS